MDRGPPRAEYVEGLQQPVYTESTRVLQLPMREGSWRSCARDAIICRDHVHHADVNCQEPFLLQLGRDVWLPVTSAACQVCGFCGTVVSRELAPLHLAWCSERAWAAVVGAHVEGLRDGRLSHRHLANHAARRKHDPALCRVPRPCSGKGVAHCSSAQPPRFVRPRLEDLPPLPPPPPPPPPPPIEDGRRALLQRLLSQWHGHHRAPEASEVLLLRSSELAAASATGIAWAAFFVGVGKEAVATSAPFLYPGTLARELRPAAERLSSTAEAEEQWAFFVSRFFHMRLSACADRQKMRTDSAASYGRHGNTLSPHENGPEGRTGYAGWGQYENAHAEVHHGRGVTSDTLAHLEMVTACLKSASLLAVTMYRPRGQNIAHCDTCEHNDRQRGDTLSLFRWLEPARACLLIRTDVLFYVSLVAFHGVSFLPICVHPPTQAGAEPMLLGYVWETDGRAREIVIKYSSIDSPAWRTVGMLDVVVCGIRDGQVRASARVGE